MLKMNIDKRIKKNTKAYAHKLAILNRLWDNKITFNKFQMCDDMNNLEFSQIAWISFAIDFIVFRRKNSNVWNTI